MDSRFRLLLHWSLILQNERRPVMPFLSLKIWVCVEDECCPIMCLRCYSCVAFSKISLTKVIHIHSLQLSQNYPYQFPVRSIGYVIFLYLFYPYSKSHRCHHPSSLIQLSCLLLPMSICQRIQQRLHLRFSKSHRIDVDLNSSL